MTTNDPEIVTREEVRNWPVDLTSPLCAAEPQEIRLIRTIELFAGLLEEFCCLGCEEDWELCEPCQRKAAALRRYRGGVMSRTTRNRRKKLMRKNEVCHKCGGRITEFYPVGAVIISRPSGKWKSDFVC